MEKGTAWYRSKKPVPVSYYFVGDGYLSNKKWHLMEVCILLIICTSYTYVNAQYIFLFHAFFSDFVQPFNNDAAGTQTR